MNEKRSLLRNGMSMVMHNKRYIIWFWLLNLVLAWIGASAFGKTAHSLLDHSFYSDRLLHGFDLAAFIEFLSRPESGTMSAYGAPAMGFSIVFALATALFLPGVFQGYASTYRLPREDFFRACGRNLWRFIRLIIIAGIVMLVVTVPLFLANGAIATKAGESTNELLPFRLQLTGLAVIFLIMTTLRIWFDLAEADVVLNDQRAVRKSIASAFRHTFRSLIPLLIRYVAAAVVAGIILLAGLWFWLRFVPASSVMGAVLVGQITLFLLLIPRFWQRGVAVSYWQQKMMAPAAPVAATPEAQPVTSAPEPAPVTPEIPSAAS